MNIINKAGRKIVLFCFIMTLFFANTSQAQIRNLSILNYSMGLGVGKTNQFISKYSWRGFDYEYRHFTQPTLGIGFNIGWNTFYESNPYQTYVFETVSATGYQFRYFNSFPIMAVADYFARPDEQVSPYIGLGLGVQYNLLDVDFGIYRFERDGWPFTIAPEIGTLIHLHSGEGFNIGIKYMYGFKTTDLPTDNHLLFNVGFAFGR
jgi:opacity protein-like surface antigen